MFGSSLSAIVHWNIKKYYRQVGLHIHIHIFMSFGLLDLKDLNYFTFHSFVFEGVLVTFPNTIKESGICFSK
jgi:hypothetical protein